MVVLSGNDLRRICTSSTVREFAGMVKIISDVSSSPFSFSTRAFFPSRDVAYPDAPPLREVLD